MDYSKIKITILLDRSIVEDSIGRLIEGLGCKKEDSAIGFIKLYIESALKEISELTPEEFDSFVNIAIEKY